MTREIIIDRDPSTGEPDTVVGYGFQSKQFFIDNKGTRTTRKGDTIEEGAKQTKRVLDIVAPDNTITWQGLQSLAETPEEVTSLSCTYEDSGAFIKTITLNDYDYYPIVLDCPLHKLYIMNTDKVYDLTLNVDPVINTDDLISFYELTLGLDHDDLITLIPKIYSFLLSWYTPHIYNHISPRKEDNPLYYSDTFSLSNYSGEGSLTYTCTLNPYKIPATSDNILGYIIRLDTDNKLIQLTNTTTAFDDFPETEDTTIIINGLSEQSGSDTYSADGKYTMTSKDTVHKTFTVKEAIPFNFSFPYPKVYKEYPRVSISKIDNTNATIVVGNSNDFNIGDTVTIHGSSNRVDDGDYGIIGKSGNTLTLDTVPPVSLEGSYTICGRAMKLTYVGEASLIGTIEGSTKEVLLRENSPIPLSSGDYFKIGDTWDCGRNNSLPTNNIIDTTKADLPEYNPMTLYPTLTYNKLAEIVNINVTSSTLEELPEGEFNVDTYEQCHDYIGLGGIPDYVPDSTYFNEANKQLSDNIPTSVSGIDMDITVKGLYSEFYS